MKKLLLAATSLLLLAACSTPRYTYYFDHYDYNSGKKKAEIEKTLLAQKMMATPEISPLQINQEAVTASAARRVTNTENVSVTASAKSVFEKKYLAMSRAEKKDFRKELKSEVKKIIKAKKSGESITAITATKALDHDLKMALIFGIVGIILTAFAGVNPVFWILGVIAGVVAIVFLISWIANQ
jgi:F0F1-type ATP synthase assembly protein I